MSKPDIDPSKTASGIAVDPRTLDRVVPQSKRPDGSVRKEIKIRPGFTPQEDVSRFRGSRQQQADRNALPKGHILGWVAPSSAAKKGAVGGRSVPGAAGEGLSKAAAKNAKKRAKKQAEKEAVIKASWEESDGEEAKDIGKTERKGKSVQKEIGSTSESEAIADEQDGDALARDMEKLNVR